MLPSFSDWTAIPRRYGASSVGTPCYSLSDFVPSLQETTYGNVARNSCYGPGYVDIDATLFKNFSIRERMRLSVGARVDRVLAITGRFAF
jgi:hypothetical protein